MGVPHTEAWRRRKKRGKPQAERQGRREVLPEYPEIWVEEEWPGVEMKKVATELPPAFLIEALRAAGYAVPPPPPPPPPGPTREALFQAEDEIEGMRKEMLAVARELEAMAAELGGEERTAALAQRLFSAASTSHMRFGHAVVLDERTMMSGAYRTWILRIGGERVTEHMARECANRRVGAGVARINHCYLAESGDEWLVHLIANEAED